METEMSSFVVIVFNEYFCNGYVYHYKAIIGNSRKIRALLNRLIIFSAVHLLHCYDLLNSARRYLKPLPIEIFVLSTVIFHIFYRAYCQAHTQPQL